MKRVLVSAVAVLALAACNKKDEAAKAPDTAMTAGPAAAGAPTTPPARKAGLWEQKMSTGDITQVSRICFDDAVNRKMSLWGQQAGQDICQEQSVTPGPGGWTFRSTCQMGSGGTVVSTGQATGDFGSHYTVKAKTTTTGAAAPQMNGEHDMTLEATWKGPCPPDFKPGDMELPGGMKINMLTMAADGAGGGKPSADQVAAMRKQAMEAAEKAGR